MPEGPEIRRAADSVARVLLAQQIDVVQLAVPRLRRFERRLTGRAVTAVDTRGKAMLTRFDNGLTLYSHNQLYGRWYTMRRGKLPDTGRQLRVALHTGTHSALLYSASDIAVLTEAELARHPFLRRLGPDILDRSLTVEAIAQRLDDARFRNRALGSLYLDQAFLAGNGNYLRSEILWASALDPRVRPADLRPRSRERLARETLRISRRSYRTRGVTVAPALAGRLKRQGLDYGQYRFYAFDREGQPCHRCGYAIERRTMASRNLFLCPACQSS